MGRYVLNGDRFILENYDRLPAFSSFLPGLAGVLGIPIWVFYTNRGQGINSFGIHHKGNAMMEFNPANTAFENTAIKGFRTFLRVNGEYFEPFSPMNILSERTMEVEKNLFTITENDDVHGISVKVCYYGLPEEHIGALVRNVTFTNTSGRDIELELLDGMAKIIPYGIQNGQFKEMSNLFKSWADIINIDHKAPVFAMRASSDDSAEVSEIRGGYFYTSVCDGKLCDIVYDAERVFAYDSSLLTPVNFAEGGLKGVNAESQCFANKVPCAFTEIRRTLKPGEAFEITSYAGYTGSIVQLNSLTEEFCKEGYETGKRERAEQIADKLTLDVSTHTADNRFDKYIEQCYLDNFLRGGYPFVIGSGKDKKVVHLFSRKHGDPERDYNFFATVGEFYSQGNGNFRDVCQNRRNDVFFNPETEDFDVFMFFSLIQADGYNPLEIRPCTFSINEGRMDEVDNVIDAAVQGRNDVVKEKVRKPFTPGGITSVIAEHGLTCADENGLVEKLLDLSTEQIEAGFGEGYWSDHWDYLMDLVDSYLSVYPDKLKELAFGRNDYRFYDSIGRIRTRRESCVLTNGKVRQYNSLYWESKDKMPEGFAEAGTNWLKNEDGSYVTTNMFGKALTLALTKLQLLDPLGMGIEMEGGKPGWNDAMNGLPALFGSGMPETLELIRVFEFLKKVIAECGDVKLHLPKEIAKSLQATEQWLTEACDENGFGHYHKMVALREEYRKNVYGMLSGTTEEISLKALGGFVDNALKTLNEGVEKAVKHGNGIIPTYFTYEVTEYDEIRGVNGEPHIVQGLPAVYPKTFKCCDVPYFLEGPAKYFSCVDGNADEKAVMHEKVMGSEMYDKELHMLKTSVSIENVSMEHGRVRAFTPGWLERESVFLHMEYKYLLGLLKSERYNDFYAVMKDMLVPFLKPEVYGRSTLENSSFIASSANPDKNVHGRGFVARLSGSTTEMLSIWLAMFLGKGGFKLKNGELCFELEPQLPAWLYDEKKEASFTICSRCKAILVNNSLKNDAKVSGIELTYINGKTEIITGNLLNKEQATALREGKVSVLKAEME